MNYDNFINNLHVGSRLRYLDEIFTVVEIDRKAKLIEISLGTMSTVVTFDYLYHKYKNHSISIETSTDPSDYYDTDLWFEVEDNKNLHICENCDDYAVCDFGDRFDMPCSQFEWRTDKLHEFVKERIGKVSYDKMYTN